MEISVVNDVNMEVEEENKENLPPPASASSSSIFSHISAQVLKFLPKSFNHKRTRADESEEESNSNKKIKKLSLSHNASIVADDSKAKCSLGKGCKSAGDDKSFQYMMYMSERDPLDI